jgi:hypothetical protein
MKTKKTNNLVNLVIEQKHYGLTAKAYPRGKEYVVTRASANRLMDICNSGYSVYHYTEDGMVGLEIMRNG